MALSNVATVRARLAVLQGNISGVKKAFSHIPQNIESRELPCFITRVTDIDYDYTRAGEGIVAESAVYQMQLYVKEALTGRDEAAPEEAALAFIDPVRDYFLKRPGLEIDAHDGSQTIVYQSQLDGIAIATQVDYPTGSSKTYAAIQFTLNVTTLYEVTYI